MRKEILDALKAKFTGVSDAILGRIADKLAKTATTAEQVATAVEGGNVPAGSRKLWRQPSDGSPADRSIELREETRSERRQAGQRGRIC